MKNIKFWLLDMEGVSGSNPLASTTQNQNKYNNIGPKINGCSVHAKQHALAVYDTGFQAVFGTNSGQKIISVLSGFEGLTGQSVARRRPVHCIGLRRKSTSQSQVMVISPLVARLGSRLHQHQGKLHRQRGKLYAVGRCNGRNSQLGKIQSKEGPEFLFLA